MFCKNCEINIENFDIKVCPYCGTSLTSNEDCENIYTDNPYSQDNISTTYNQENTVNETPYTSQDINSNYNEPIKNGFLNNEITESNLEQPNKERKKKKIIVIVLIILGIFLTVVAIFAVVFAGILNEPNKPVVTTIVSTTQPTSTNQINKAGNSVSNTVNHGLAAMQNGVIYYAVKEIDYSKPKDYQTEESGIYRMRADGNEKTPLCNANAEFLNVVGDYLYFSNIDTKCFCRMKIDGSDLKTILAQDISYVTVMEDAIYYINNDTFSLNKMNLDGTGSVRLVESAVSFYSIVNEKIFYKISNEETVMYSCDLDGQNQVTLEAYIYGIPIIDNEENIYCSNGTTMIFRTKGDASGETVLWDNVITGSMAVTDKAVYFSAGTKDKGIIQGMDLTGANVVSLFTRDAKYINIAGDYIFCLDKDDMTYVLKTDGTSAQMLSRPRDKESEQYMRSLIENEANGEILSFYYLDYDLTGKAEQNTIESTTASKNNSHSNEAFALVGKYSNKENCYIGEVWFANTEGATKLREAENYSTLGDVITFKNERKSYFKIETAGETGAFTYVYGVSKGEVKEASISGKGLQLLLLEDDTVSLLSEAYDASLSGSGYTKKRYYFYHDANGFHEYGGLVVPPQSFEKIYGASTILATLNSEGKIISNICYRNNYTFAINYTDGEWQGYQIFALSSSGLKKIEGGEGFYENSIIPSIAVYPSLADFLALVP